MNIFEQKQEDRRARLEQGSEAATARSDQAYEASRRATQGIEMGQPILVGHHSEGRHRGALKRSDSAMRRSVEETRYAEELARKAAAVGTGGISSDDPDALAKLRAKVDMLRANQEKMKGANKAIKANKTPETQTAALVSLGYSESEAYALLNPRFSNRPGYPAYALTNNNANIRQTEKRIQSLEVATQRESVETEGEGYSYHEDTDENRVMFRFPSKPDAGTRQKLKDEGFKFSPGREGSPWVRKMTGNGLMAGYRVRNWLDAQPKNNDI